ncbi:hypothetical protein [Dactylosporangium matsuzakiense]|uniref:hypothetical protein n=1 Tax=Dactylosporangium matsuzakiense TaxID=53360 RepID=UPI0021C2CA50|nr:hypothetical protein [Dactylosporangium matsuzakiense]UWZ41471.1 hypothetical protein Dmats_27825 [Dactylosporangium matsuzakiense]
MGWPLAGAVALVLAVAGLVSLPWSASAADPAIQDTARGGGLGQAQFTGGWSRCAGTCAKASDNSYVWTDVTGAAATVRFTGRQIAVYGVRDPAAFIATATIDGGPAADVDEYAPAASAAAERVWTSPVLADGAHTLVLRLTNRKHPASAGGKVFTFDRADIVSNPAGPGPSATRAPAGAAAPAPALGPGPGRASGLPWSDGGYFLHDPAQADAFAAWRGRPVDNILAFTSRATFTALLNPWWADSVPASFSAVRDDFIVAVPLWSDDGSAGTDAEWAELAAEIAAVDADAYVRLGWEMNCCTSLATDPAVWRAQFTRAATLLKTAAPGLRIVFNPNEGTSEPGLVKDASTLFVPGLVDVVAIDAYDWHPSYDRDAAVHFTKQYGWDWWYTFARSKGLPFALGEFGVMNGYDDPAFFTQVYSWLRARPPGTIAFVTLFNEPADYCRCSVYPPGANPAAAARYREIIAAG